MMRETVFTNARIVTRDEVVDGTVRTVDGRIAETGEGATTAPGAIDLGGDYLLPGFVELHTDNLEKHFSPRPGVAWPALSAVVAHDAQIAASGITTVFDALAIGDLNPDSMRLRHLRRMAEAIEDARVRGILRAEHMLHLRCEVSHPDVVNIFETYVEDSGVRLVSLMDHTPGQRQFAQLDKYKQYYQGKYGLSDDEIEAFIVEKRRAQQLYSAPHRSYLVEQCRERGITMASHDDATEAHVDEAIEDGVAIAEFPTTLVAARKASEAGLGVLMGAPNVVLGGSHSGNVAATELARHGVLDILSSDYVPSSMVQGVFRLWSEGAMPSLPAAVATVSATPARAAGLDDRGEIAPGKRADLVRVAVRGETPVVVSAWRTGERMV
jgi:alpha-D-ribose 1-methylphosphonate 5-triphosphate diphosphatase